MELWQNTHFMVTRIEEHNLLEVTSGLISKLVRVYSLEAGAIAIKLVRNTKPTYVKFIFLLLNLFQ